MEQQEVTETCMCEEMKWVSFAVENKSSNPLHFTVRRFKEENQGLCPLIYYSLVSKRLH